MNMAAPNCNTNASKWTLQATLDTLEKIETEAHDDRIYTLGMALVRAGVYQGVWSYWKKKWADNEEVMERIYFIDQLFINKLIDGAITKRLHFGMCMFALRVNHGISDKPLKEDERMPEEKIPAHLKADLEPEMKDERPRRPLLDWMKCVPGMFTNVRPRDGRLYREHQKDIYTSYTEEECDAAMEKVTAHQKAHGVWYNWVLPEEEYVHGKMKMAA